MRWTDEPVAYLMDILRHQASRVEVFRLNYLFCGLSPWWWHACNVALHAACCALVARTGAVVARLRRPFAAFAALLFAVHPVHTEAVGWRLHRAASRAGKGGGNQVARQVKAAVGNGVSDCVRQSANRRVWRMYGELCPPLPPTRTPQCDHDRSAKSDTTKKKRSTIP
ncbi:hypothetical protein MSG28_001326 [Choristoneura fumiferana]|uniref:Uncharacterized protein n=1 Tax=Choristoneura fumiferana TaxID=7141 RepID=A0ACC0KUA1_CHOFU|nr:hypothetical protein MSG28_001326 [Choristoneura fumiferana]